MLFTLKNATLGLLFACLFGLTISTSVAQEKTDDGADTEKLEKVIKGKLKDIKKLADDKKWKKFGASMTEEAANEFCCQQLIAAVGLRKIQEQLSGQIPGGLEGLDDIVDEIDDILDEHKIDPAELGVDKDLGPRIANTIPEGKKDGAKKALKESQNKILKALNKDGKKWEIVGKLFKAQSGSMFTFDPLNGKVEKVTAKEEKGKKVAVIRIKPNPPKQAAEGGMQIKIMAPPVYVRFEKDAKKGWLYCGVDKEATQKAMKEFMQKQRNFGEMEEEDIF